MAQVAARVAGGGAGARAALLLTFADGTSHITVVQNHKGTIQWVDPLTGRVGADPLFGPEAGGADIVAVEAVAATADGHWLPFNGHSLGARSEYRGRDILPPGVLAALPDDQQDEWLARMSARVVTGQTGPADILDDSRQIAADAIGVHDLEPLGNGWWRVTTTGRRRLTVGVTRGQHARTQQVGRRSAQHL